MSAPPSALQAAPAADGPLHVHGRKASWFDLLLDLAFVVVVAQLSSACARHSTHGDAVHTPVSP